MRSREGLVPPVTPRMPKLRNRIVLLGDYGMTTTSANCIPKQTADRLYPYTDFVFPIRLYEHGVVL